MNIKNSSNDSDNQIEIDLDPIHKNQNQNQNQNLITGAGQSILKFDPINQTNQSKQITQSAKVSISPHRLAPLKKAWPQIYSPIVEELGLLVRMNVPARRVELKTSKHTISPASSTLTKAINFLHTFNLGFSPDDALALLRLEEIYLESFEIKDVKALTGDHLSRAIGRIAGKDGRTRFTIENASRTRIVLADTKIHILGSFSAIKIARDAICALILGSPPGKVYNGLRTVAARQRERF
ncbi:hypothetical protein O181_109136 [Austropuccinia psidii MF-1]|uniref:Pre-rRNA-processing protein PNO1 n=1 Tax=Austropuccinia psidii MF-1 TaxID=1389203 RepID=A0A9Q3PQM2_9BASI|nr:hypothetical protein [Austropuccinia psidii MF-1]